MRMYNQQENWREEWPMTELLLDKLSKDTTQKASGDAISRIKNFIKGYSDNITEGDMSIDLKVLSIEEEKIVAINLFKYNLFLIGVRDLNDEQFLDHIVTNRNLNDIDVLRNIRVLGMINNYVEFIHHCKQAYNPYVLKEMSIRVINTSMFYMQKLDTNKQDQKAIDSLNACIKLFNIIIDDITAKANTSHELSSFWYVEKAIVSYFLALCHYRLNNLSVASKFITSTREYINLMEKAVLKESDPTVSHKDLMVETIGSKDPFEKLEIVDSVPQMKVLVDALEKEMAEKQNH